MKKILARILILFGFMCTVGQLSGQGFSDPPRKIESGYGPEDIVQDTLSGPARLLVSCCSRRNEYPVYGEIESIDPEQGTRRVLKRLGEPAGLVFRPHGISLAIAGEIQYLYCISHDDAKGSHSVIKYQIAADTLEFISIYKSKLLVSPNALQAYADGSFFVCNDAGIRNDMKEKIFRQKKGNILHCDVQGNWSIVASNLGMPAGLAGSGNRLYCSAALENKLYSFEIAESQLTDKQIVSQIKGPDNIRLFNNSLIVTSHPKPLRFIRHVKNKNRLSPSLVLSLDPITGQRVTLFSDDGSQISAGSVGLLFQGQLIIGQIFEPFILVLPVGG